MTALVECVPNFSEGRDADVIQAIVTAISTVAAVRLLDVTSDYDHHRTVVTFVGSPAAVSEAAFQGIAAASRLIDLRQHHGQHPRIGAADVVPLVPLRDISMAECVVLAQQLGQRVGSELGLPVYLYEAAATRPERRSLAVVRRGGYEALAERLQHTENAPDFGPSIAGSAGAVVIGARPPLIAFNVFLNTDDVNVAQSIAKAVRASSGGLAEVRALGLLVDGRAQVSMNLTDYQRTPLHQALELVRREAQRYGVLVQRTELIGLIPQEALLQSMAYYVQLPELLPSQVLETAAMAVAELSSDGNDTGILLPTFKD